MAKRVSLGGGMVTDARTKAMLDEASRLFGKPLQFAQGSYHKGVGASAGTHDDGGVVDVRTVIYPATHTKMKLVRSLRRVGFAAWLRPYTPGVWGEHCHCVAIGCDDLAPLARAQVTDYRHGRDGLAGHRPDPQASLKVKPRTWERYQRRNPKVTSPYARVWESPGGAKHGRRKRGERIHIVGHKVVGKVTWLRLKNGRWVKAKRTDWKPRK